MLTNNPDIHDIAYGSTIDKISEINGISIQESKEKLSKMTFTEYVTLLEIGANITPPSGQPIGTTGTTGTNTPSANGQSVAGNVKAIWPGKGAPVEVGMTVGLKDTSGLPIPGEVSHVDMAAKGAKIKNPKTGKEEWVNLDTLQPFMAQGNQVTQPQQTASTQPTVQEDKDIQRLRTLAGIAENCSAGATGVGAIAMAPTSMGKVQKREKTEEEHKVEYTPKGPAKSIIGDTKPFQATGKLSADLAANGKKTASRANNGFKK
jgi:hypothetical protein